MSKSTDKRYEEIERLLEELLGPVEDWSTAELDRALADAGVDVDVADRELFERVSRIAGSYRQNNRDVPGPVAEFLRQMRPADLPTRDATTDRMSARNWITRLRRPRPTLDSLQVAYSFRNKKDELAPKDRAVLDALETKLRSRKRDDGV